MDLELPVSDTPETDAAALHDGTVVSTDVARKLERERDEMQRECLKQCELLAVSGDREEKLRDEISKYREAAAELIRLLEIEEESDSGSPFKPNRINSCRIMDAMQMNQCLQTLKRLSQ